MTTAKELAAQILTAEVGASIPQWVTNKGVWYADNYGFTGSTAYLSEEMLTAAGMTLAEFIDELLEIQP